MRWLADENFNNDILRAMFRRRPSMDVVRVQDVGLGGRSDPEVLAWAGQAGRVLLTHDVSTLTAHAYLRVSSGQAMPGVFEVGCGVPVGAAADDILLLDECSVEGEWEGQVRYLPLR